MYEGIQNLGRRFGGETALAWSSELFGIDPRSLALFRVLAAAAVILNLWMILPDIAAFYSDSGLVPRDKFLEFGGSGVATLYTISGSEAFSILLVGVNLVAAFCLLVGFRARIAAAICWVLYLSLTRRNFLIINGGDVLLNLMLFWAMFLPIGSVLSVDAALTDEPSKLRERHVSIATVGVMLQTLYVYFFGALLKTEPEWTQLGSAVYAALHLDVIATPLGHWLRQYTGLTHFLSFYVLWLEFLSPVLLFPLIFIQRVRLIALMFLVSMHIGFRLFLDIGYFWLVSIVSLSLFVPTLFWNWLDRKYWRDEQRRIVIYYDKDCVFCRKVSLILKTFCLPGETKVLPAQDTPEIGEVLRATNSWVVVDWTGKQRLRWEALVFVLRQSLLLRPFAWLLALVGGLGAGARIYTAIGSNRKSLGTFTSPLRALPPFKLSLFTSAYLATVLVFCLVWNITQLSVAGSGPALPGWVTDFGRVQGFTQRWSMFAPFPQLVYVVPVAEGSTRSGKLVDAFNPGAGKPSYEWPSNPAGVFPSQRWRIYVNRLAINATGLQPALYPEFARWLCSRWRQRSPEDALEQVKLTLLVGETGSHHQTTRTRQEIGVFDCPG